MITYTWFDDAGKTIQEKVDVQNINESMYFLTPPGHEQDIGFDYPFTIMFSGSGIWRDDACVRWGHFTLFAIELVTAGNMRFSQDGKEYVVEAGTAYTLRPGSPVELRVGDKGFVHKRFLVIRGRSLDAMREHCGLTDSDCVTPADPSRLGSLMRKATFLLRVKHDDYLHSLSLLAYDIMLTLSYDAVGRRYPPAVNAVLHFMNRNLHRQVTIEELSAAVCLSRSQLHRVFKEHLTDTPLNYFAKMKIRQAATVLRGSPQRVIRDVALQFGFEDQAYFANLFRKIMGMTPSAFRVSRRAET